MQRESLDDLFLLPQSPELFKRIMRERSGLRISFYTAFVKRYIFLSEVTGYMWEALPIAMSEYNPEKGKAVTIWGKVTLRLMMQRVRDQLYVGGVKIPRRQAGRILAEPIDENTFENYLIDRENGV